MASPDRKTKAELIEEFTALRRRLADLEVKENECVLAKEALSDSQRLYRTIFENTGTATVIIEEDTTLSMVNTEFARLAGYAQSEIEGTKSWMDFVQGADLERMREYHRLRRSRPEAAPKNYEFMFIDRYGATRDILATVAVIPGTQKSVASFLDITERKRAAGERERLITQLKEMLASVSRSKKEWQDTFDSITDLIYIVDRKYNIIKANKACADHLGLDPQDLIDKKCYVIFHGERVPVAGCPHTTALREQRVVTEEGVDPESNRLFRMTAFPYCSPDGQLLGTIVVKRDITEKREQEMRLIITERLASLGELASGIAHEINNPLASIGGCAEGLLMRLRKGQYDPALFEKYLKIIEEEVQRCKQITTTMLSFVRQPTYDKKAISLHELLDRTIELIGFQSRLKEMRIVRDFAPEMPSVIGSEGELRQVFMAVITNALDAMRNKGTLTLSTRIEDRKAIVSIGDSGPGVAREHLSNIFEPFFTTKVTSGGTGLGLSIAKKIIEAHNGDISVTSKKNEGTVFTILLPL
ncbi:MAG: PAS domain S-box protein [Nitrospirota bacterium]